VQILDEINQQIEGFIKFKSSPASSSRWRRASSPVVRRGELRRVGLVAGLFNSIPYIGPIVVTGGLGVIAFMQFNDLAKTAYVCAAVLAITSLEGFLLVPALMSRAGRMNPVAVFVGLLFWTWVWGVWGTILAVPMLMMIKAVCDHVEDLQPIRELLEGSLRVRLLVELGNPSSAANAAWSTAVL
jgi:hypothetical protein